jgi:hypothetical protein
MMFYALIDLFDNFSIEQIPLKNANRKTFCKACIGLKSATTNRVVEQVQYMRVRFSRSAAGLGDWAKRPWIQEKITTRMRSNTEKERDLLATKSVLFRG